MNSFLDAIQGAGHRLGRYFSVVSLLPALALVFYITGLVLGGGGTADFRVSGAFEGLVSLDWRQVTALVLASFLLALVTHPLQFAMTQVMEGYWGTSSVVSWARVRLSRRFVYSAYELRTWAASREAPARRSSAPASLDEWSAAWREDEPLKSRLRSDAAERLLSRFPTRPGRVMPTRLGNILRRHEDEIGRQYGLDVLTVFPHLTSVADSRRVEQAADEAEQMDFGLRLTAAGLVASLATLGLLAPSGAWTLIAVVPLTFAYIAYRGACSSAESWMGAVAIMVDLDRVALYDALRVPRPVSQQQEADWLGPRVNELLAGQGTQLLYVVDETAQYLPNNFPNPEPGRFVALVRRLMG